MMQIQRLQLAVDGCLLVRWEGGTSKGIQVKDPTNASLYCCEYVVVDAIQSGS